MSPIAYPAINKQSICFYGLMCGHGIYMFEDLPV